jgi:hypothetical protein
LVVSVGVVVIVLLSWRAAARALSARCVSRVDGIPIRELSMGETLRLLRGIPARTVSVVVVVVVLGLVIAFDESVVVLELGAGVVPAVLSVC